MAKEAIPKSSHQKIGVVFFQINHQIPTKKFGDSLIGHWIATVIQWQIKLSPNFSVHQIAIVFWWLNWQHQKISTEKLVSSFFFKLITKCPPKKLGDNLISRWIVIVFRWLYWRQQKIATEKLVSCSFQISQRIVIKYFGYNLISHWIVTIFW